MNLSIIIPHLRGKSILDECVQSIYDNINSIKYELIIVNNNSQDQSIDYISKKFKQCMFALGIENNYPCNSNCVNYQFQQFEYKLGPRNICREKRLVEHLRTH